jgi:hypothetical protein
MLLKWQGAACVASGWGISPAYARKLPEIDPENHIKMDIWGTLSDTGLSAIVKSLKVIAGRLDCGALLSPWGR